MGNEMDIVFLGGLFPKEIEDEIYKDSKRNVDNAANALQWSIIEGLDYNNNKPVKIINSVYIGSFPKLYKKIRIPTFRFSHTVKSKDINVGFINLFVLKQFFRFASLKKYLKKWTADQRKNKIIIAYSLTSTFVWCLKYIKRLNPNIKTCIIVTDLPEYMNMSSNTGLLYRLLKNYEIKSIKKNIRYIDYGVFLTKYMNDVLKIDKYIIMEGITPKLDSIPYKNHLSIKTIVYTGSLAKKYGILNLVCAFKEIDDPNFRLVICGRGDAEDDIRKVSVVDKRIIYKGLLQRNEVLLAQTEATVLVNPRQNNEAFTKYSFPSKTLEYMMSGRPVIMYKLDGIPDEYDPYLFYVKDNSILELKNRIIEICSKPEKELIEIGENSRKWVMLNKNNIMQTAKIIDLFRK